MRQKPHVLIFFFILLASGCTDDSKIDRLQAKFDTLEERNNAALPTNCFLRDIDRDQEICMLATARALAIGDIVFVGDDMWRIEAVKLLTSELPPHLRNPKLQKVYKIAQVEFLVKFQGKSNKRHEPENPESSSQPP